MEGRFGYKRLEGRCPGGLWDLYLDEPVLIVCEFEPRAPFALSNLLPPLRLRRNRRTDTFTGRGVEDPHCLYMIPAVERMLRPPV